MLFRSAIVLGYEVVGRVGRAVAPSHMITRGFHPTGTNGVFGVDGQFDLTRARFADGTNVPRIPPTRIGAGVFWRNANFMARVSLLHAFAQNRIAANETPTAGYNLLNAELRYTRKVDPRTHGVSSVEVALTGTNLLDERIRNHVSFRKNEVLAPGRGARLSATVRF